MTKLPFVILTLFLFFNQNYLETKPKSASPTVKLGIDVLLESNFNLIQGKKVALLTNNAGRNSKGKLTAEIFSKSKEFELVSIFTPEHGFFCDVPAGKYVDNDTLYNVPVYSLYGANRKPLKYQLEGCDVVVVDLQDIGIRSYTYISTMFKMMEACAENQIPIIILDRPNPLGGLIVDGNVVEKGRESFVGIIPVSYIHGCTIGELAKMINGEGWLSEFENGEQKKCDLTVVKMKKWQRWMSWEDTGLEWLPTSPNIPTTDAIKGAAITGIFGELGIANLAIGTKIPFQYIGFKGFDTEQVLKRLKKYRFNGIKFIPTNYSEIVNRNGSSEINGLKLEFSLDNHFLPYTYGFRIFLQIRKIHPERFNPDNIKPNAKTMFIKVTGTEKLFDMLFVSKERDSKIIREASSGIKDFTKTRIKYLLY
ncbi:MAG: DUF1343 domain-containing protein [Candidatus Kapabacteria bacterium]|nr:DUF1343 domain-containing protein [Candidatus Kapabacteria bacterium]